MPGDLLDTTLSDLFRDDRLLHRVIRGIQLDRGGTYIDALDRLQQAAESASAVGNPILREALEWGGRDVEGVRAAIRLLERRDAAVQATLDGAMQPIMLEQTNAEGLVLLDQGDREGSAERPTSADVGVILTDPAEQERRLARMRKVEAGSWIGDQGRAAFLEQDRLAAESGFDLVRSTERKGEILAAQRRAQAVAVRLDRAIENCAAKRSELRRVESEISKMGTLPGTTEGREQVREQLRETLAEPVRLLDQLEAAGEQALRELDDDARVERPSTCSTATSASRSRWPRR